jgi:pyruvate kinase
MFDDGKFHGVISSTGPEHVIVRMKKVRGGGARLRADKGINFPKSRLTISGLTEKDREDLQFVVAHADIVNMSFVNSAKDVRELMRALRKAGASKELGVVLKIETHRAFRNLVKILLEGMQMHPLGVMIARGDLAIEVGWERIAVVQREIMKMCHAAHVPDIWATQVFENLAKSGVPSRAEMTDVWVAQRSECVMLNKGPYIIEAIELLDTILSKLQVYHDKDSAMLPSLKKASN